MIYNQKVAANNKQVINNLNTLIRKLRGKTDKALAEAATDVINEAVDLTPWDEGNLAGSYYQQKLRFRWNNPAIEIGNTAKYAAVQHENLEFKHDIGEAKFLEKAVVRSVPQIKTILKRHLTLK